MADQNNNELPEDFEIDLGTLEESSTDENQSKRKGFWDKVKDAFSEK